MYRAIAVRSAWAWAATAILGFATGCGEEALPDVGVPTYPASGKILKGDGAPLTGVIVTFVPADPKAPKAFSTSGADGRFVLNTEGVAPGAPAGDYKIRIELDPDGGVTPGARRGLPFPAKYSRETTSDLTATVKADAPNEFEFTLK